MERRIKNQDPPNGIGMAWSGILLVDLAPFSVAEIHPALLLITPVT